MSMTNVLGQSLARNLLVEDAEVVQTTRPEVLTCSTDSSRQGALRRTSLMRIQCCIPQTSNCLVVFHYEGELSRCNSFIFYLSKGDQ
jgi:hypothetical protein